MEATKGIMPEKTEHPITITDSDFESFISKHPVVLIDCWAPWCGPCRMVSPIVDALAKEYSGRVTFGKLNTDENPAVVTRFGIMAIPTLLVLTNGKHVDSIVGAVPKARIESVLTKHLEGNSREQAASEVD